MSFFIKFKTVAIAGLFLLSSTKLTAFHHDFKAVEDSIARNMHRLSAHSLNRFGKCVYSQYGEDGIIEEIFRRIGISNGFFVEFGAFDGISLSNTRHLWEKGWNGVMIEQSPSAFAKLKQNYAEHSNVKTLNAFVTWRRNDNRGMLFDEIRETHFPNQEIDF